MHIVKHLMRVIERSAAEHEVVCRELPLKEQLGWGVLLKEMAETLYPRQAIQDQQNLATAQAFGSNALNMLNTEQDMVALDPVVKMVHSGNARSIVTPSSEIVHLRMVANDVGTPVPFVAEEFDDMPVIRHSNVVPFRHNRAA
jgi:hypothetical protein